MPPKGTRAASHAPPQNAQAADEQSATALPEPSVFETEALALLGRGIAADPTTDEMEVAQLERLARRQDAEIAIRRAAIAIHRAAIANRELAVIGSLDTPGMSFPPLVLTVATELSGVASEDVNDVRTGKMEPWNLIRLHPIIKSIQQHIPHTVSFSTDDVPSYTVELTATSFTTKKKTHTAAEYTSNPLVFFSAFLNYILPRLRDAAPELHQGELYTRRRGVERSPCRIVERHLHPFRPHKARYGFHPEAPPSGHERLLDAESAERSQNGTRTEWH
ncbi:hypothetical protein F4804DRAFT_337553 [Jackrogersella minutella]|nr:hypothetical protein F4804DRAFT_337553 [Jackrogersella minutella]